MSRYYYITPKDYEVAERNGISNTVVNQRVRVLGWSIEKSISLPLQERKLTKEHFEIAATNGIKKETVKHRVHYLKWDIQEAITKPTIRKTNSWLDVARSNGINLSTYRSRLCQGWSEEKAATTKTFSRKQSIKKALEVKNNREIEVS